MIGKIKSNKGSTLITAVVIMIIVASLGIFTSLVLANNARISLRRIDKKMEIIKTENMVYDFLNNLAISDFETWVNDGDRKLYFSSDGELKYSESELNDEKIYFPVSFTNGEDLLNYIFIFENVDFTLECEVIFSNISKSYIIVRWGV